MKIIFPSRGNEKEIVKGCLRNDRHFQRMLFDKYKDAMYTVAYRILRDEEKACDALQDGFIQVFTGLVNFRFQASLGSWIKTIMVRSALRIIKKEFIKDKVGMEEVNETIEWDCNLTGETLDRAIAALSPGYRSVFLLIEVEGYNHHEVAEMLNITEGTSKSQLSRAKKNLQEKLKDLI